MYHSASTVIDSRPVWFLIHIQSHSHPSVDELEGIPRCLVISSINISVHTLENKNSSSQHNYGSIITPKK